MLYMANGRFVCSYLCRPINYFVQNLHIYDLRTKLHVLTSIGVFISILIKEIETNRCCALLSSDILHKYACFLGIHYCIMLLCI
jgi:hypothetical protein